MIADNDMAEKVLLLISGLIVQIVQMPATWWVIGFVALWFTIRSAIGWAFFWSNAEVRAIHSTLDQIRRELEKIHEDQTKKQEWQ